MRRHQILTLFILFLLAGCIGEAPTTGPVETPLPSISQEKNYAQNSLDRAIEKYDKYLEDHKKFQEELDLAESRGVDISIAEKENKKVIEILSDAQTNVDFANELFSLGEYESARNIAENTVSLLDETDSTLNQANDLLKSAYDETIEIYQNKIQETKKEIVIASAFIQDANNSGAEVNNLDTELKAAFDLLSAVERSFSALEFYRIDTTLKILKNKIDSVKEDALYSKRNHLTSLAITEIRGTVKTQEGNEILNKAIVEKNKGNFQNAIDLLNSAIILDVFTAYELNKEEVINYCNTLDIQINTASIESTKSKIVHQTNDENYSEALISISEYKALIEEMKDACINIYNSKLALESLKDVNYLRVKPDIDKASEFHRNAVEDLKKEKYSESISYAEKSITEAQKEKQNFYLQIKKSIIKNTLSKMLAIFGKGPPDIVFETVEGIQLSWLSKPESLVNIDLSPPVVNIDTGELEITSSPSISLPVYETFSTSKKSGETPIPIDFSLSVPEPSYDAGLLKVKVWGTATIKNTGSQTAHNVKVRFELFSSGGKRIKLSGRDYIEKNVGDLGSGTSKIETIEFTIGIGDGYGIQSNGAKAIYHIYSDEKHMKIEEKFTV